MWTTPSVVSIFARWLPSSTSSTMSGWSPRAAPTASTWLARRPGEVHPDARVGVARAAPAVARSPPSPLDSRYSSPMTAATRIVPLPAGRDRLPTAEADGLAGSPGHARPASRAGSEDGAGFGGFPAIGFEASARRRPRRGRPVRRPAYAGAGRARGTAGRRARSRRRPRGTGPTMIRRRLARRPFLERVDDERVAQRPVVERRRDELRGRRPAVA